MRKVCLAVLAALFCILPVRAQTLVTGNFLTPTGQTPAAAGLAPTGTIGGFPVCGTLIFTPYDSQNNQALRLTWNGVTYFPQFVTDYVRCSDGALLNPSGTVGQPLIPNTNSEPLNTTYQLSAKLNGSSNGVLRPVTYLETRIVPDQAAVNWNFLQAAGPLAPYYAITASGPVVAGQCGIWTSQVQQISTPCGTASAVVPNDPTTGTALNSTATITTAGNAILATTSNTTVPVYIVVGGAGIVGNAVLATGNLAQCVMDASLTGAGGVYVVQSILAAGQCHPQAGAPASGTFVIGYMQSSITTAGQLGAVIPDGFVYGGSGGGGGSSLFQSWQFGGNPVITGSGNYLQLTATPAAIVTLTQSGAGSAGSPFVNTFALNVQGTDTKLLSSGAVATSAAALCTDASGGATTTGCGSGYAFVGGVVAQYYTAVWVNPSSITGVVPGASGTSLVSNGLTAYPTYQQVSLAIGVTGLLPNTNLANPSLTINGQTIALGASGNIPFLTLGTPNASLAGLNFVPSTVNAAGLLVTPVNLSGFTEQFEITGTVLTAVALATTPSQCTGTQFAQGIGVTGNANCAQPTVPIGTNGTPNASQLGVSFNTSTTNAVGLTITPVNSATNVEKFEITGATFSGNAATATALASVPSQCGGSQFVTGIQANGNANCGTPAGSGNMSTSGTPAQYEVGVFVTSTTMQGAGPGTAGWPLVGSGALAYPVFAQLNLAVGVTGSLPNANLANSSIGIAGTAGQITSSTATPALGGSTTLAIANPFTFPGKFTAAASTISVASGNFPSGSSPSAPVSGDFWNVSGILDFYDGTHTNSLVTIQSALTNGSIPKASGTAGLLANGYAVQGTDANLITSGTISGTGAQLCTDANGGATTSGCSSGGATFQANGSNLANQTTINFVNSAAVTGITLVASNPTLGQVTYTLSGTLTNAGLANSSVTFNGQTVALGASGNIPIQTNGTPNTSQAGINHVTSTTNSVGLTITPVNSATNVEKFEITGASYTGNAATATALASLPSQCGGSQFATGIAANGNANCGTPSTTVVWNAISAANGNATIANTSFTTTFTQTSAVLWAIENITAATSSVSQSSPIFELCGTYWNGLATSPDCWSMQDVVSNGTNGGALLTFVHSGTSAVTPATGLSVPAILLGLGLNFSETTGPATASGLDTCYGDSTLHGIKCQYNNGGSYLPLLLASGSLTPGDVLQVATGSTMSDAGLIAANALRSTTMSAGVVPVASNSNTMIASNISDIVGASDKLAHSLIVCGPYPQQDVACYGYVADAATGTDGAMTSGSAILTSAAGNFAAGDVGKHIVVSMWPVQAPVAPTVTRAGAGSLVCQAGSGSQLPTVFFVEIAEKNAGGLGQLSPEGFVTCNTNSSVQTLTVAAPAVLNGATTYTVYVSNTVSGAEQIQTSCTNLAIATNCVLTTLSGSGAPTTTAPTIATTILSFQSATQVTLNTTATATVANAPFAWYTDNATALTNAFAACPSVSGFTPVGCTLRFPVGTGGVATGVTTAKHGITIECSGATVWLSGSNASGCQLGTADNITILKIGTLGSQENAGVEWYDVGTRDLSGTGNAVAGLELETMAHAYFQRYNAHNFTYGTGLYCNSGSNSVYCQYNRFMQTFSELNKNGIVFGNGKHTNNTIDGGEFTDSKTGGAICVDFKQNATVAGGSSNNVEHVSFEGCATAIHSGDDTYDQLGPNHIEGTGRGQSVIGVSVDASAAALANNTKILDTGTTNLGTAVVIGTNVVSSYIENITLASIVTPFVNLGTGTQIISSTGYLDFPTSVGPIPSITGGCTLYVDSITGNWTGLNGAGSSCLIGSGGGGSPGGSTFALQYNNTTFAGLAAPTVNGLYGVVYNPVSSAAVAPTTLAYVGGGTNPVSATITSQATGQILVYNNSGVLVNAYAGVNVDPQTGNYTLTCPTDRLGEIEFNISAASTLTVPQAGGTTCMGSNAGFVVRNASTSTAVLTVSLTTSTFQPENVGTKTILPGAALFVYSDATSSTGNYHAISIPKGPGGVNIQTSNYSLTFPDKDKVVVMNCSSACIASLPATPFSADWTTQILSIGATLATVNLNGTNFNLSGTAPVLLTKESLFVSTDGTNYYGSLPSAGGGGGSSVFPLTVSGTVVSGGIPCFTSTTAEVSSAILNAGVLPKGGGAGVCPLNSSVTDNGTTVTTTDTGGYVAPVFTTNGSTAGYFLCTQGTDNGVGAVNTITTECPTAVTAYEIILPGAAGTANQALTISSVVSNKLTMAWATPGTISNPNGNFTLGEVIVAASNTTGIASSPAYLDCSVFTGADWTIIARACLTALASINATSGIADMRGVAAGGTVGSLNPEGGATIPASGEIWMGGGSYGIAVPWVDHQYWSVRGETNRPYTGQGGTTIIAGAGFPAAYSTGTITVGSAGAGQTVTGVGTAFLANVTIGEEFYTTGTNSTWGIVASVTSNTALTLAWGVNNGSGAAGGSAYQVVAPVHVHGNGAAGNGNQYGMAAVNINFDCNNVAGCIGDANWFGEQEVYDQHVEVHNFNNIGFDFEGNIQNSMLNQGLIASAGTSCTANTLPMVIRTNGQQFKVDTFSGGQGLCATQLNVGIDVEGNYAQLYNIDNETPVVGIALASNPTCPYGCPQPPRQANGTVIDGAWNLSATGTTIIHISSAEGALSDVIIRNVQNGRTNGLVDDNNACTETSSRLSQYIVGHTGGIQDSTSQVAGCTASPTLASLTLNGSTAGYLQLGQGSTNATAANTITYQAPTSVTAYIVNLAGTGPANNNMAKSYSALSSSTTTETFVHAAQSIVLTGAAYTNATTGFTNVASTTNLAFTLDASAAYSGDCYLVYSASASTAGPKIEFTGPAGVTAVNYSAAFQLTATPTYADSAAAAAFSASLTAGSSVTGSTNLAVRVQFGVVNGSTAGTLQLLAASQGTGTLTIQPGSYCRMQ